MLVHCGLLLLFFNCVRTTAFVYPNGLVKDRVTEVNTRFSWWPSVHNAMVKMKREEGQLAPEQAGVVSESGDKTLLSTPASLLAAGAGAGAAGNKSEHTEDKQVVASNTTGNYTIISLMLHHLT